MKKKKKDNYKVMTVGDWGTGRTCFSIVFAHRRFPMTYVPSVADICGKDIQMNEVRTVTVNVWEDHGWGEDYDVLRPLSYPKTKVFLALYSVASRESLVSLKDRWIPEVRHYCPGVPVMIVANKIDLRDKDGVETVSSQEGLRMAKDLGTSYYEVSAKQMRGVDECLKHAVELADVNTKAVRKRLRASSDIIPPITPIPDPAPAITPAESTFVGDWTQMMTDPKFHDVTFVVQGGKTVFAHKLVLCSASPFFTKLFISNSYNKDSIAAGEVQGIQDISSSMEGEVTTVELSSHIQPETFDRIVEFLYTGSVSGNGRDIDVADLKRTALMLGMNQLDVESDSPDTIGDQDNGFTFQDVLKPMAMREYLKQDLFSDIVFRVKDTRIAAHMVVLHARCPKMAELCDSPSVEGESAREIQIPDASVENFTLFLDYLYTDQPDVDATSDLIGLVALANTYGAHRLVTLCEVKLKTLHIINEKNAFELLQRFKKYKTKQLVAWCLHYISQNHSRFSDREEFTTLDADERQYIENERRPFLDYEKEREVFYGIFRERMDATKRTCLLM